jgi:hypothetical protein
VNAKTVLKATEKEEEPLVLRSRMIPDDEDEDVEEANRQIRKKGGKKGGKFKISREKFSARREGNRSKDDDTAEHEPKTR